MTPDERASNISKGFLGYDHPDRDALTHLIAAEIRQAVDAALRTYIVSEDLIARQAKSEAYEEAAKVAESMFPTLQVTPNTPATIAKAIRELKSK